MLQFYMNFWMRYRETLLDGAISADSPEGYYSQARARLGRREVVSVYTDPVVACTAAETVAVNVSPKKALYVKGAAGRRYRVVNCLGEEIENGIISAPLQEIVVPMSGILFTEE